MSFFYLKINVFNIYGLNADIPGIIMLYIRSDKEVVIAASSGMVQITVICIIPPREVVPLVKCIYWSV